MNFKNCAPTDFTIEAEFQRMNVALATLENQISRSELNSKIIINGEEITSNRIVEQYDPSDSKILLGKIHYANIKQADQAIHTLENGHQKWSHLSFNERAAILNRAADIMLKRRYELAALVIREVGKTWKEADADVVEAIDFCNYYAAIARKYNDPIKTATILGESNFYLYKPKGLALIIAPWNFPLAIACGMLTAALVCGNVAILKPAEQSSLIATALTKILLEAGVHQDALCLLPGAGEEIGDYLVKSEKIHLIAFTGSRPVGLNILKEASLIKPGQRHIKKVIAELGGKNCIIVDEDADLDQAILGILHSAFAYAGQKCSACSRVIVVGNNYQLFLERLEAAIASLIINRASSPESFLGPVIDAAAHARILKVINENKKLFKFFENNHIPTSGYFISPTVFVDVDKNSDLWREEIFGPVLAVVHAESFQAAIAAALDSDYALTGGIYSRSPKNISYAYENFLVGNLYINRSCTGAIVERQPFGGFKLSGIGSKAGGPDYLLQFLDPRTITENTIRRGFTPDLL